MNQTIDDELIHASPARSLSTFRINPSMLARLTQRGFLVLQDLAQHSTIDLSKEIECTPKEAYDVLKTIKLDLELVDASTFASPGSIDATAASVQVHESELTQKTTHIGQSAFDLLQMEGLRTPIVTFCSDLDTMLGGGVQIGQITEFCGEPGIGKTQIGIQLATNAHIPDVFGGANGHSIYIDTEGSFMAERVSEIVEHVVDHMNKYAATRETQEPGEVYPRMSMKEVVSNMFYYRVHDFIEQIALTNILPAFLDEHPKVRIIVIDSITFHFRHDFGSDMAKRTRLLQNMANQLMAMATKYNLAVVLMNQMTTKMKSDRSQLVPALGESWSHVPTNRINLHWKNGVRYANLVKSPSNANKTVPFSIVPDGVRSYVSPEEEAALQ